MATEFNSNTATATNADPYEKLASEEELYLEETEEELRSRLLSDGRIVFSRNGSGTRIESIVPPDQD